MPTMRACPALLALALAVPAPAAAPPSPSPVAGIAPLRSYSQALQRAAESGKNILLLFSNPHCGPCHAMETVLFGTPTGIDLVSASFVPVVLVLNLGGTDKTPETREARSAATRFGVLHPPTLLIVSRSGSKVGRIVGITRPELFSGLRHYAKPVP